jgi:oxaloacetate decarboxylase alpha subunit
MNVLSGERYKVVSKESKGLLRGEYGKLPGEVDEDVRRKCIGNEELITCRPADLIEPELDHYRELLEGQIEQEEDILSYAMFPQVAPKFFEYRKNKLYQLDVNKLDKKNIIYPL